MGQERSIDVTGAEMGRDDIQLNDFTRRQFSTVRSVLVLAALSTKGYLLEGLQGSLGNVGPT